MNQESNGSLQLRYAVRGPLCAEERKLLQAYVSRMPELDVDWFDARDDEELGLALVTGRYRGCIFADAAAATDAAIAGNIKFESMEKRGLELRLAVESPSVTSPQASLDSLITTENVARRRRIAKSRRQTIAAAVLSAAFLAGAFGLFSIRY